MRLRAAFLLLILLPAAAMARTDLPLDKSATDAIDQISAVIAKNNHFTADQETDFYIRLSRAAHNDKKTENALTFGECGNHVLKSTNSSGLLNALTHRGSGGVWNDLQKMARNYQGDGVLPIVNYNALTTPDGPDKLADASLSQVNIGSECADKDNLLRAYRRARELGFTPQEAYGKVQTSDDPTASAGVVLAKIENSLCCMGKVTLTGYDKASAHKDLPIFLESNYAYYHTNAPDTKAVTPAADPFDFIDNKVRHGIQLDLRRSMRPVNSFVDKFLDRDKPADAHPAAPPVDNTPNFNDLNRTPAPTSDGGAGMPTWDQMKLPAMHTVFGEIWDLETWWALQRCPRNDMELKCQRIAYGLDVFKIRQASSDHNDLRIISSCTQVVQGSGHLQHNKTYVAAFNVWYWGENGTKTYFGDGSDGGAEPPASMRAYLPASSGKTFLVKVHFKTDARGIGRIALFARGRCALELGESYYVHVVEAAATAKK